MIIRAALLAALVIGATTARAQAVDETELAFWQSVAAGNTPAEYRAYLHAYPAGRFAPLARLRAGETPAPVPPPVALSTGAVVRPASRSVRLVDGVVLDVDATSLRTGSNLRLIVVPAGAPDAPADPAAFAAASTPAKPSRMHLTIPAGPPGHNEARLYQIAPFADTFSVAARAPVEVEPGVPGATLARDLVAEAVASGPVAFEAAHRDRPLLVQAAFLRVQPRTEYDLRWFGAGSVAQLPRAIAVLSLGMPGATPDAQGSLGRIVCVVAVDAQGALERIARLRTGDPVAVRGLPTMWGSAGPADPVVMAGCSLEP